jgi:hypothetical protein
MSPAARLHGTISTFTIGTVYWILLHLSAILPSVASLQPWQKAIVAYVTSAAVYGFAAAALRFVLDRWQQSRQWFLGASYVEGTWIGCYKTKAGEKRYSVEHFEQTLDGLTIRGQASDDTNGTPIFTWTSKASSVDADTGTLTFSYTITDLTKTPPLPFEGIANFTFERPNTKTPPQKINGYSADLSDMTIYPNREILLSRQKVDMVEAWNEAKRKTTC